MIWLDSSPIWVFSLLAVPAVAVWRAGDTGGRRPDGPPPVDPAAPGRRRSAHPLHCSHSPSGRDWEWLHGCQCPGTRWVTDRLLTVALSELWANACGQNQRILVALFILDDLVFFTRNHTYPKNFTKIWNGIVSSENIYGISFVKKMLIYWRQFKAKKKKRRTILILLHYFWLSSIYNFLVTHQTVFSPHTSKNASNIKKSESALSADVHSNTATFKNFKGSQALKGREWQIQQIDSTFWRWQVCVCGCDLIHTFHLSSVCMCVWIDSRLFWVSVSHF